MIAFQPWIREKTSRLYKVENIENLLDTKGQLISKANCQAMNSSKKQRNEFVFTTTVPDLYR